MKTDFKPKLFGPRKQEEQEELLAEYEMFRANAERTCSYTTIRPVFADGEWWVFITCLYKEEASE